MIQVTVIIEINIAEAEKNSYNRKSSYNRYNNRSNSQSTNHSNSRQNSPFSRNNNQYNNNNSNNNKYSGQRHNSRDSNSYHRSDDRQRFVTIDIRQIVMIEITAIIHQTENKITDSLQEIETMIETIMITAKKNRANNVDTSTQYDDQPGIDEYEYTSDSSNED